MNIDELDRLDMLTDKDDLTEAETVEAQALLNKFVAFSNSSTTQEIVNISVGK